MLLCATLWLISCNQPLLGPREFQTCGNQSESVGSKPRSLCFRLKNLLRFHVSSFSLTFQTSISLRVYLLHGTRPLTPFNFRPPCIRLHIPITAIA
jgi:hypothetical protein